jgi:LuxR family maltose regulon positive regulatory protein
MQSANSGENSITFTPRELHALRLLLTSKSNKEIAIEMCVCEKTVEFHLGNLYSKIGARTRADAIIWAVRQGMIENTRDFPS